MKVEKMCEFLEKLAKRLGDEDLTISFALCKGQYFVSVSTHTSEKLEFDHDGYQRSCELRESDFNRNVNDVASDLVNIFKGVLKEKEPEDVTE